VTNTIQETLWNLRVAKWFDDRNLTEGSDPPRQFIKLLQEYTELYEGELLGRTDELKDGIGDTQVVLCGMAHQIKCPWPTWENPPAKDSKRAVAELLIEFGRVLAHDSWRSPEHFGFPLQTMCILLNQIANANGLTMNECQEQAWGDIEHRIGYIDDSGVFVKNVLRPVKGGPVWHPELLGEENMMWSAESPYHDDGSPFMWRLIKTHGAWKECHERELCDGEPRFWDDYEAAMVDIAKRHIEIVQSVESGS
jgi:hypothetical protein